MNKNISQQITQLVKDSLHQSIISIQSHHDLINSTGYTLVSKEGNIFLAKIYRTYPNDLRNRLETEYTALDFLWKYRIRTIPKPLLKNSYLNMGIYTFIKGNKIRQTDVNPHFVKQYARFLKRLDNLKNDPAAIEIPPASEPFTNIQTVILSLEMRIKNLTGSDLNDANSIEMKRFINKEFSPFFQIVKTWISQYCKKLRIDPVKTLPRSNMTLSPSDVGFHNCLISKSKLFFLDFEYFGWDDPAKMISDFFLQQQIKLPYQFRELFFKKVYSFLGHPAELTTRLPIVYPLCSARWCLILLNCFLPERIKSYTIHNQKKQLEKSRNLLTTMTKEFNKKLFPYSFAT